MGTARLVPPALAVLLGSALFPAPAPAAHGGALRARLGAALAAGGGANGAFVEDLDAGQALFGARADSPRSPASVEKLYTSATALERLGADHRFTTRLVVRTRPGADGVVHGDLWLQGGGDPTFGSAAYVSGAYGVGNGATVEDLADAVRRAGVTRIDGAVRGDESYFDNLRGSFSSGYARSSDDEGQLSGLSFNRGLANGDFQSDPPRFAAAQLAAALKARGIPSHGVGVGPVPADGSEVAKVTSPSLGILLGFMNRPSDNYFAETLVKDVGAGTSVPGTTRAGAAAVRDEIRTLGGTATVVDGSGLARSDRTSPRAVVTVLESLTATAEGPVLRASLPVAGRSGTLASRMRGTTAAGRCQAKTGTLSDVSALAGFCHARDGHTILFAFMFNHCSVTSARAAQDRMTIELARYDG